MSSSLPVMPAQKNGKSEDGAHASLHADNERQRDVSGWESPRSYGWWGNHAEGPKPVFESTEATVALLHTLHELNEINAVGFGQQ